MNLNPIKAQRLAEHSNKWAINHSEAVIMAIVSHPQDFEVEVLLVSPVGFSQVITRHMDFSSDMYINDLTSKKTLQEASALDLGVKDYVEALNALQKGQVQGAKRSRFIALEDKVFTDFLSTDWGDDMAVDPKNLQRFMSSQVVGVVYVPPVRGGAVGSHSNPAESYEQIKADLQSVADRSIRRDESFLHALKLTDELASIIEARSIGLNMANRDNAKSYLDSTSPATAVRRKSL